MIRKQPALSIVFHGGEPLLRFPLLAEVVEWARREIDPENRLRFAIQTNATLLDEEKVAFFEKYDFSVGISLDGMDNYSNSHRVSKTSRSPLSSVLWLIDRFPAFVRSRCGFLAVASKTSAPTLPDFALWLQEHGISAMSVTFLDLVGRGREMREEKLTPEEAVELFSRFIDLIRSGALDSLALKSLISRIDNLVTFTPREFCHKGPCAAAGDFLLLDAEGTFRSCDCIYHDYFKLGTRTDPINATFEHRARHAIVERHEWLRESGPLCHTCPLFGLCGGTCIAKALAANGTPRSIDPIECALARYVYPEVLYEFVRGGEAPLLKYYAQHKPKGR